MSSRFPFPGYPKGWFAVALSSEVPERGVVAMRYFGRDLIAFRAESGRVHVSDAYCPHLGAHLGHGGTVVGETVKCPFHGWQYDGSGRCVAIPYTDKIPPRARIEAWHTLEQDGVIHVFFDPSGGAPWPLPKLEQEGWTEGKTIHWPRLRTHPQEVFENTVDMPHIGPVHGGRSARLIGKPRREGEHLAVDLEFQAPGDVVGMPDTINDVMLEVRLHGLGCVFVHTHVRNVAVRARQRIYVTPVDEEMVDIRGVVQVAKTDDAAFTDELHRIFHHAYVEDFAKDFPIWENKRYLDRPMLAKNDGPIGTYRQWCKQFYAAAPEERRATPVGRLLEPALGRARDVERGAREAARRFLAVLRPSAGDEPIAMAHESEKKNGTPEKANDAPVASITSVEDYFATLERRFVPSAARGVDAVFQWELAGEGGGVFHAHVRDEHIEVQRGAHERASVRLLMPADDYVRMINGELDGMKAFTVGRGKVKGDITLAMKMRSLFPQ
jgi:phenylpropionate dioxygenase-like ring-hydroxylating dioxygenase large terminal subunit/putative sterol carrier protein